MTTTGGRALVLSVVTASSLVGCSPASDDPSQQALESAVATRVSERLGELGVATEVLDVDCDPLGVPADQGAVDALACRARVDGTAARIPVTVTLDADDPASAADVVFDALVVTQLQGIAAVQPLLDDIVDGVTVRSCALPDAVNVLAAGARFTCDTDSLLLVGVEVGDELSLAITGTRTTPRK